MRDVFRGADALGPAKVLHVFQPALDLRAILVVDNVACGPAIGGLRMAPDVSLEECARLARAMTFKNAAAGLPHGGGKSVLFGDPRMEPGRKESLIRAFATALRDVHEYIIGPDMGTDERCMAWAHDEIGRAVGLPREIGGIPLDELGATGWGMYHAVEAALPHCPFELAGARVAVQGFGAVGIHAARFLTEHGAVLVAAADSRGCLVHPDGIDVAALTAVKRQGGSVTDLGTGTAGPPEAVIPVPCEIWIPAARPDVITTANVDQLDTKLIVQGANIPIAVDAEAALHARGVLSIPDFIANAGGVICAAMEYHHAGEHAAFDAIAEKVRRNTEIVLQRSRDANSPPRDAAVHLARERIEAAMATRRWQIF